MRFSDYRYGEIKYPKSGFRKVKLSEHLLRRRVIKRPEETRTDPRTDMDARMNDKLSQKNSRPLSLRVPEPSGRPGDAPDFSHLLMDAPGAVERPEVGTTPYEMRDLAFRLIRVLDDEGQAVGPWNPRLDPDTLRRGLKAMILTRAFDDRMHRAHRQGKTSFYMKCTGEEAIAVAQGMLLSREDMGFPTYRQQGLLIARGYPLVEMMNQIYSNAADPIKGRQLPIMYSAKD